MSSGLQQAMSLLIQTFKKYAEDDDDKKNLSKGELLKLLRSEMGNLIDNAPDKEAVDKLVSDLDYNKDGKVDFNEFVVTVCTFTMICNELSESS